MKKSITKHIALGILASAILTACGGGGSSSTGGKQVCTITFEGGDPYETKLGQPYVEPGFTIKDGNGSVIPEADTTTTGLINTAIAGDYTLTYGAESCSSFESDPTRVVRVLPATTGTCNYKLNGDNPLTMTVGSSYQELGVTITDANNKDVTDTVTITGNIDRNKVGDYRLTYQSDSCTNTTTRTVKVVPAQCTYTVNGIDPLLVDKGDALNDPGVTAIDSNGQPVKVIATNTVDTSKLGSYTITYQGEGCANNETRGVMVELQTCAITLKGASPLEIIINGAYTDPGAEIKDKLGTVLEASAMGTGSVDVTKEGQYVISYKNNACANTVDRIVKVRALTADELKDIILPK